MMMLDPAGYVAAPDDVRETEVRKADVFTHEAKRENELIAVPAEVILFTV